MGSCFTNKHCEMLERFSRDRHSSLLLTFVNYCRKKFYNIVPWCNLTKPFTVVIYKCSWLAMVFAPGRHFQPCLMFVSKARSLPYSGAPERFFTWVSSALTRKLTLDSAERLERVKRYSLFQTFIKLNCKKFLILDPGVNLSKLISSSWQIS